MKNSTLSQKTSDQLIQLLENNTTHQWCKIPTRQLKKNQCAVIVAPQDRVIKTTPSTCYVPQNHPHISNRHKFIKTLKNKKGDILAALPAIKYDLDGIAISVGPSPFKVLGGVLVVEGKAGLTGDIIIKPKRRTNNMTLSINELRTLNMNAQVIRHDFIQSLKIKTYIPGSKPVFSLGTSFSDLVSMTSTSVALTISGTTTQISANFNPTQPIEITDHSQRVTIEAHMGYQFLGKATYYPSSPSSHPVTGRATHLLLDSGIILGTLIVTVFSGGTDLLLAGGAAVAISA